MKRVVQIPDNAFRVGSSIAHVQSDDRMFCPFLLHIHNLKSLEQLFFAFEICLYGVKQH